MSRILRYSKLFFHRTFKEGKIKVMQVNQLKMVIHSRNIIGISIQNYSQLNRSYLKNNSNIWFASLLTWLGLTKSDESPEDKLINVIKRSILCIQREQYDRAEQILHLALRMAQDIQSKDGITYVYDIMANLAMEREQFKKSEKLFADVIKRLIIDGHKEDSPKILHISSKLAHMAYLQGEFEKAKLGFNWTLEKLEQYTHNVPDDLNVQELCGITKNWFGQLLIEQGNYKEAKKNLQDAYECLIKFRGLLNEDAVTILNNLSVACVNMKNLNEAKKHILEALRIIKDIKITSQEGILTANLGLIYLQEGLIDKAKNNCSKAWKIGKQHGNNDAIEQAEYCLLQIKEFEKSVI